MMVQGEKERTLAAAASASLFFRTSSSTLNGVGAGRFAPHPTFFFFTCGSGGGGGRSSGGGGGADTSGGGGGAPDSGGGGGAPASSGGGGGKADDDSVEAPISFLRVSKDVNRETKGLLMKELKASIGAKRKAEGHQFIRVAKGPEAQSRDH